MKTLLLLLLTACGTKPSADTLSWMEGCWDAQTPDYALAECWQRDGDALRGEGRIDDSMYETTAIGVSGGTLQYVVTKRSGQTVAFTATEATPSAARFENPAHDDPKWIAYRKDGEDIIASVGVGAEPSSEWRFTRR